METCHLKYVKMTHPFQFWLLIAKKFLAPAVRSAALTDQGVLRIKFRPPLLLRLRLHQYHRYNRILCPLQHRSQSCLRRLSPSLHPHLFQFCLRRLFLSLLHRLERHRQPVSNDCCPFCRRSVCVELAMC